MSSVSESQLYVLSKYQSSKELEFNNVENYWAISLSKLLDIITLLSISELQQLISLQI